MIHGLLLSGAVRAAVVLATGLGAHRALSRAAAATRRFVLALTLGASIVVPLVAALGPKWTVDAPEAFSILARESASEGATSGAWDPSPAAVERTATPRAGASARPGWGPSGAIVLTWLAVAAALLVRAAASHVKARVITLRATQLEKGPWVDAARLTAPLRPVVVRASAELDAPAVTGVLRPTILVPRAAVDWPAERCRLVLVHEMAHVRRRDVLVQAMADVACAIHWWNPLVWICARRFRAEREIAADDVVLADGVRPSRYAEELVAVASSSVTPSAALAMAERASLEARVASILAARLARAPLAARGTVAIVALGSAIASAAACTSPELAIPRRAAEPALAPPAGAANDDPAIQLAAEEELAAIGVQWDPDLATIVVMDPATGEILANAGRHAGVAADVASTVAMPPGSTLKPITIAAALELHAITVEQRFECGPSPRRYGDKVLHDASENGPLDVAHLLAISSNVGTSRIFDALGGDNLASWLHRFHFGEAPGLEGAVGGGFPAHIETGSFEGAVVALGEGLTATPLQMIAAYGALAGEGVYHAPTLERGGSAGERLVSPETARSVMALLETAVMDPTATGKAARVDGVHVAGKTGTAQWTGPDGRDVNYASFIGVADLPSRRIVALVGVQSPRDDLYGGNAAAPVFARLVSRIR